MGAAISNPSRGAASIGGLAASGANFDVDTKGLQDLSSKIRTVTSDIAGLTSNLDKLLKKADAVGASFDKAFSSLPGSTGGKANRNTAAPVSGGAAYGAGGAIAGGVAGEIGAQFAGQINSGMAKLQNNGMAIDLQTRQAGAVFGGNQSYGMGGVNTSGYTNQSNMSQADLSKGIATQQATQLLFSPPNSARGKQLTNFVNAMQKLNPGLGNQGASQFAAQLVSGPSIRAIQLFGNTQGGLLRPGSAAKNPEGINSPGQAMSALVKTFFGGKTLTPQQMKSASGSSPEAIQNWAKIAQNFGTGGSMGTNFSPQELLMVRQYMSAGGNLSAAQNNMKGSVAGTALGATTAKSKTSQDAFEATADVQNWTNDFKKALQQLTDDQVKAHPLMLSFGVALAGAGAAGLAFGAKILEAKALLTAVGGLRKGEGVVTGLAEKGLGGLLGGHPSSTSGSPDTSTVVSINASTASPGANTRNFDFAVDNSLMVSLSPGSIQALGKAVDPASPAKPKKATTSKSGGGGGEGFWAGIGSAIAGAAYQLYKATVKNNPGPQPIPKGGKGGTSGGSEGGGEEPPLELAPPMGDPTGSTSTMGLSPTMAKRVSAMQAANPSIKISSGHRTSQQQATLYNLKGGQGVAKPGMSAHQSGHAADVGPPSQFGWIAKNASKFGLGRPAPKSEPWHLQAMGDPASTGSSVTGSQIVTQAETWIGTPYVYGGEGTAPGQGVDCSRFVQEVFANFGISLPRTSEEQATVGSAVAGISAAQPGDIILYNYDGPNSHVAIYIGNGQQVSAPETGQTVQIQSVDMTSISTIRRIVSGGAGAAVAGAAKSAAGSSSSSGSAKASTGTNVGLTNTFISSLGGNTALGGGSGVTGGLGGLPNYTAGKSSSTGSATSTSTTPASNAAAPSGGSGAVVSAVKAVTSDKNVQIAMLMGAQLESGQDPTSNGENVSYGAWQIEPSANPVSEQQAENVNFAAQYMVGRYTGGVSQEWGSNNPKQITEQAAGNAAYDAERPAESYFQSQPSNVGPAYALAISEVGDPVGLPAGPSGGSTAPVASLGGGPSGGATMMSVAGGSRVYHLHMPVTQVSNNPQDAVAFAQAVHQHLQALDAQEAVAGD